MKRVIVFPGQGSQRVGMGKDLADAFPVAQQVFQEVDDALGQNLSKMMFEGPAEELVLTENAQPAIMANSIAVLRVLEREMGFRPTVFTTYFAGHSLGEYTALCAGLSLSLADTARLLKIRGKSMQRAMPAGEGAMAALVGADIAKAKALITQSGVGKDCVVANDNSPEQVAISGKKEAVEKVLELAMTSGLERSLLLPVSAPFHSPFMTMAAADMDAALAEVQLNSPTKPLVSNVTAKAVHDPVEIRKLLVQQVCSMVRWRESVQFLAKEGVTYAAEMGAGKVLAGLIRRTDPNIKTISIASPRDMREFEKVQWY